MNGEVHGEHARGGSVTGASRFLTGLDRTSVYRPPWHRMAHVKHPVALDDHLRILEHQVAVTERPGIRLPAAEDGRHDVDRHEVDEPQRVRLAADLTRAHTDLPLAGQLLRPGHALLHRDGEVVGRPGCQHGGFGRCDTTTT